MESIDDLVRRVSDAAAAFIRGDMQTYVTLIAHTKDHILMAPYGGEPHRGFDDSPESLAATARNFAGGEVEVELVETYASGDLAVLVMIERQHAQVAGLPDQEWSLRVTLVFRREEGEWRLAHRHADPLTYRMRPEAAALLARGAFR